MTSPFFHPTRTAQSSSLAILHLRRDQLLPTTLIPISGSETQLDSRNEGYAEGPVVNTRFGSFPHSTLIGKPWGSQVAASIVDTGSRGRSGKKRKRESETGEHDDLNNQQDHQPADSAEAGTAAPRAPVTAASGFCHLLPPTPEAWTVSLPHRTQVVYTPDSSYVLQRLRVRPGSVVIEAGAGSGSFTHAAARAVFDGYPDVQSNDESEANVPSSRVSTGRVYSFEYHEPRALQLREELASHGLAHVIRLTHRDVYRDGFMLDAADIEASPISPNATAIFLDLPQPWLALPHLTRQAASADNSRTRSALDPSRPVHICIFVPCIEQVSQAASALRQHGWVDVQMVEVAARRIEVRRERVGYAFEGLRGVHGGPANVLESVERLREVEARWLNRNQKTPGDDETKTNTDGPAEAGLPRRQRLENNRRAATERKTTAFRDGRLITRTEPEIRTHTSYLIFAILPLIWTPEDEHRCRVQWGVGPGHGSGQEKENPSGVKSTR